MNNYKSTWHTTHFIISLLTCGFWIPFWVWRTLVNSSHNREVELHFAKEQLEEMKRINRGG